MEPIWPTLFAKALEGESTLLPEEKRMDVVEEERETRVL